MIKVVGRSVILIAIVRLGMGCMKVMLIVNRYTVMKMLNYSIILYKQNDNEFDS